MKNITLKNQKSALILSKMVILFLIVSCFRDDSNNPNSGVSGVETLNKTSDSPHSWPNVVFNGSIPEEINENGLKSFLRDEVTKIFNLAAKNNMLSNSQVIPEKGNFHYTEIEQLTLTFL